MGIAVTGLAGFAGEDYGRTMELCPRKVFVCVSLGGKSVEDSADNGSLACDVSEGSKDPTRPFVCGVWSTGAEESAVIKKRPGPPK